jgi:hypothetical protein
MGPVPVGWPELHQSSAARPSRPRADRPLPRRDLERELWPADAENRDDPDDGADADEPKDAGPLAGTAGAIPQVSQ